MFTCFMQFVELNSLCGHIVQWFAYTVTVLCDCLRHVVCLYFSVWSPLSCGLFIFLCGYLCHVVCLIYFCVVTFVVLKINK